MLTLLKEDFKNVLLASVQKDWDQVYRAMSAFTYFDGLDDIGIREGCLVAKLKTFERNDIILGDGEGLNNFVYFILTGRCQMVESLQVIVTKHVGKTQYALYDPYVPSQESEVDLDVKYFGTNKSRNQSIHSSSSVPSHQHPYVEQTSPAALKANIGSILKPENYKKPGRVSIAIINADKRTSIGSREYLRSQNILSPSDSLSHQNLRQESVRINTVPEFLTDGPKPVQTPANMKTVFMQVVQFNPGSTFGFGETMRDRRIVALTRVDCLLLPLVWLLQRNTANIWSRIVHFLDKKIPNKKALFKEFVNERRWQEYKDQIVDDVISKSHNVNFTTLHDVPYSIRMDEMQNV